jgi:hypothetical protein
MTRWFINGIKPQTEDTKKSLLVELFEKIMDLILTLFISILVLYFIFK